MTVYIHIYLYGYIYIYTPANCVCILGCLPPPHMPAHSHFEFWQSPLPATLAPPAPCNQTPPALCTMPAHRAEAKTQVPNSDIKAFSANVDPKQFDQGVKCMACEAICTTPRGLARHLEKHGALKDDVQPLLSLRYKVKPQKQQQQQQQQPGLTDLEYQKVEPDSNQDWKKGEMQRL